MRILLALLLATSQATAATLRPSTALSSSVVLLRDLFDDAGPQGGRVLGPGPAPGERIVVGSAQLDAIARQFGVDWRAQSGADRAVLEQPGRMLPREPLLDALRVALVRLGAPERFELDLSGFEPPLIPLAVQPRALVEQLDYRVGDEHFAASLLIDGAAMAPFRLRLSGTVNELVEIVVPVRRLAAGGVVRAADLTLARVRATTLRGEVAREPAQAAGLALRRAAPPGQPLALADLSRPLAVVKGARVAMELRLPGLIVQAQGIAMDQGGLGKRIPVLNPASRLIVDAEITGFARVTVAQGSVPYPADTKLAAQ
jgi:flagella basal body P-ring formation protein FlgA